MNKLNMLKMYRLSALKPNRNAVFHKTEPYQISAFYQNQNRNSKIRSAHSECQHCFGDTPGRPESTKRLRAERGGAFNDKTAAATSLVRKAVTPQRSRCIAFI
jgi:hypothetical protein